MTILRASEFREAIFRCWNYWDYKAHAQDHHRSREKENAQLEATLIKIIALLRLQFTDRGICSLRRNTYLLVIQTDTRTKAWAPCDILIGGLNVFN
jgi:hypothetical protein